MGILQGLGGGLGVLSKRRGLGVLSKADRLRLREGRGTSAPWCSDSHCRSSRVRPVMQYDKLSSLDLKKKKEER